MRFPQINISCLLMLSLAVSTVCFSQNENTQILTSSGEDDSNGTVTLESTVGELVTTDITDGTFTLEQGFQNTLRKIGLSLQARIFLQGPYDETTSLMGDALRSNNYIPTTSPYIDGLEITDSNVLTVTGNDAIVDWVFIEIRDPNMDNLVIEYRSALVQRDGDIVSIDGQSGLKFDLLPGQYYVSINHRNHLGVLSNTPQTIGDGNSVIDFTDGSTPTRGGNNAQWTLNSGQFALIAGDALQNDRVRYIGSDNDFSFVRSQVLNNPGNFFGFPSFSYSGYHHEDLNMDGVVKMIGTNNDAAVVSSTISEYNGNFFGFLNFTIQQNF